MPSQTATILIAEFPGFAELSGKLEAGQLQLLLSELDELASSTIRLHQGVVSSFTGDSFMAVFTAHKTGSPTGISALEACQEFRERMEFLLEERKLPKAVGFKAGIVTAEVIITGLDKKDKGRVTVMGQAMTLAGRLKDLAEKNSQVLTDGNVFEEANERFDFYHLEPLPVRGLKEPLEIYELKGEKRSRLNLDSGSERKIASEMVGRSSEMEKLEGLISNLAAGKGSIVNIVGKAGIGKSRLVAEMKVQPVMGKVLMLEGRALSTGQNLSYHPITNLIRSWAGITEEDIPIMASEKLQKGIMDIAPDQADEIFAFLATMIGLPLTGKYSERVKGIEGEALEKLILKNLRDLIIAATKDKPRIYLIEDMHWSDSSSLAMFESLYKLSLNHPVMFINVLRPGYKETGDYILKFLVDQFPCNHTTIHINPLEEEECENLIKNLLREKLLPGEIQKTIIRKTEGNPFFIEEILRSFLDEGIIEVKENHFVVTDKINEVNIPETINEVILSRVDKLDEKTKELLKTASVIGRNFYFKVLEEAADTIGELDERLGYLKEVQLIGESKKKDEIEYLFKHALAQQATYESIILNTKKDMHLKIARSIEKVFAENLNDFYSTLAHHYEMAGNTDKTEEYLVKAGDEAIKSGASKEAIHYYNKALLMTRYRARGKEELKVFELQEKLGYAHYALGQNIKASHYFLMVTDWYGFVKVPQKKYLFSLKVLFSLAKLLFKLLLVKKDNVRDVSSAYERKMKLLVYLGEAMVSFDPRKGTLYSLILGMGEPLKRLTNTNYGIAYLLNQNITFHWSARALWLGRMLKKYLEFYITKDNNFVYLAYLYYLSMANYLNGKLLTDTSGDQSIFEYGMDKGRIWAATTHHAYKGLGYVELGEKQNTFRIIEDLKTLTDLEHSFSLAQYHRVKITWQLKYRKLDELLAEADNVIEIIDKTDHSSVQLVANTVISMAYSLRNNLAKASEHNERAIELSKKLWTKYYLSMTGLAGLHLHMAKMRVNGPTKSDASEFLRITKNLLKVTRKIHCNKTEAFRLRAIAYMYAGKPAWVIKSFRKSIAFAQWYGANLELSRTYFEVGKFLSDPNVRYNEMNGLPAAYYLEKAEAMFEKMDLQWDLGELRKFMGT